MNDPEVGDRTKSNRSPPQAGTLDYSDRHADDFPQQIGRYRVVRILGEGGFGRVYLAHDDQLNRPVAIKVPRHRRIAKREDMQAYLAEARILATLDHPHIVPVHDVGNTEDGLCFVVSKFIEGQDLAKKIKGCRPSFGETADLVLKAAEALHYAHRKGLVHRDIKPANILVDAEPSGLPFLPKHNVRRCNYSSGSKVHSLDFFGHRMVRPSTSTVSLFRILAFRGLPPRFYRLR